MDKKPNPDKVFRAMMINIFSLSFVVIFAVAFAISHSAVALILAIISVISLVLSFIVYNVEDKRTPESDYEREWREKEEREEESRHRRLQEAEEKYNGDICMVCQNKMCDMCDGHNQWT